VPVTEKYPMPTPSAIEPNGCRICQSNSICERRWSLVPKYDA
jgi:hypothetical protein